MTILAILTTIFLITLASVMAITISYESLTLDKTPEWLEKAHHFVWGNLEKVFLR